MGRKVAILWHTSFSVGAGALYFFFVLPRWPELMGDITHATGTTLRIVTGVLIGLAALPVVFTLLRDRKPELGIPQLALSIQTGSIVAHVLAGVLIVGTAIGEIWVSLDAGGQWLFALYGAAAAVALLGFFAFYLSFVAELPPRPPKPLKPKKARERKQPIRGRRKGRESDEADEADEPEESDEADETEEAAEADEAATVVAKTVEDEEPEPETAAASAPTAAEETEVAPTAEEDTEEAAGGDPTATERPAAGLRNQRPAGKTSHRRRRSRGGIAVDDK